MNKQIKNELIATMLLEVIDQCKLAQESNEDLTWKVGYHEACDMVINLLEGLQKQN